MRQRTFRKRLDAEIVCFSWWLGILEGQPVCWRCHWACPKGRTCWCLGPHWPVSWRVLAILHCRFGNAQKFVRAYGEVLKSWKVLIRGWSVSRPRIFWKGRIVADVLPVLPCLHWAVSVPDLGLPWPHSFWGPKVPGWSRSSTRRGRCRNRCLLLWQESAWGQLCNDGLCGFSDWFSHGFAFSFRLLSYFLQVVFNLLAKV